MTGSTRFADTDFTVLTKALRSETGSSISFEDYAVAMVDEIEDPSTSAGASPLATDFKPKGENHVQSY